MISDLEFQIWDLKKSMAMVNRNQIPNPKSQIPNCRVAFSPHQRRARRPGVSLVELMAAVLILGILAAALVARFSYYLPQQRQNACYLLQGDIEVQAQLYYRNNGAWPAANMNGFGTTTKYFPDGHLPVCPTGGTFTFSSATGKVTCSHHP